MVTCICTCVGYFLANFTIIGEYIVQWEPVDALFGNDAGNPLSAAEVDDKCVV